MGTRVEEGAKADSCFNKAADDEPIFVLRAQDKLSPQLIRLWAYMAELTGEVPEEKTKEAYHLASQMERWEGKKRWPD